MRVARRMLRVVIIGPIFALVLLAVWACSPILAFFWWLFEDDPRRVPRELASLSLDLWREL